LLGYHCPEPAPYASEVRNPEKATVRETTAGLADVTEQLMLEDELPLLVLLTALVGLVVLPANHFFALATLDVADDMAARGHIPLARLARFHIDDGVEEVGLTMLATEVLQRDTALAFLVASLAKSRWGREETHVLG
jgi:hypothetical protein